ncbi:MAG: hypothetical protein NT069_15720 [Planctomycetota bacterium]|nr:hypothetical protein [Planctomycetota bacterium]
MRKSRQLLRGDPQKEYLRIQNELVTGWTYANPLPELVERMGKIRSQLDPVWLATVRTCTTPPAPIDVGRLLPNIAPLAKTTVRLNPRPGSAANDVSKMGGVFLWPKDETWPHCEDHDSAFVAALQLRKEDFPEVEFRPGTDLMQVLWCPNDHEPGYCPDVRVIWRKRADVVDPVEVHPKPAPHEVDYTE